MKRNNQSGKDSEFWEKIIIFPKKYHCTNYNDINKLNIASKVYKIISEEKLREEKIEANFGDWQSK